MTKIKSMKLYNNVERVYNELSELGKSDNDPLTVAQLSRLDQLHYHGTEALDRAIELLGIQAGQSLLEIGSGIGGPARYLAHNSNVNITALELQADHNNLAEQLSQRCGLSQRIYHIEGDFLDYELDGDQFDAVVSWLSLYHIADREKLLARCRHILKPGGKFYTEDLCCRGKFNAEELQGLETELYAITLPDMTAYLDDLKQAGFQVEYFEDMSDDWAEFSASRLLSYRADRHRHVRVHGEAIVDALDEFYSAVNKYFQTGKLAGIRLLAKKVESNDSHQDDCFTGDR